MVWWLGGGTEDSKLLIWSFVVEPMVVDWPAIDGCLSPWANPALDVNSWFVTFASYVTYRLRLVDYALSATPCLSLQLSLNLHIPFL